MGLNAGQSNKADMKQIGALNQWCLQWILIIHIRGMDSCLECPGVGVSLSKETPTPDPVCFIWTCM